MKGCVAHMPHKARNQLLRATKGEQSNSAMSDARNVLPIPTGVKDSNRGYSILLRNVPRILLLWDIVGGYLYSYAQPTEFR